MSSTYLLGLDLGTSSLKTAIIDEDGHLLAVAAEPYALETPLPGWAEQQTEDWVRAAIHTMCRAIDEADILPAQVGAIGLSGQMHGLVCPGEHGEALRPAIIWADQRSAAEVAQVEDRAGKENLAAWTGNPLATGFMLPSWLWLRQYEPEVAATTAKLLLPKDYLRFRLTGMIGTEPSDAGSTGLFNPIARAWSPELLTLLAIDRSLLPPVSLSTAVAGGLSREIARETGIPAGTPVVFGGGDQACQALGNGILAPGGLSSTIGTGGQLLAPTPVPTVDPELRVHLYNHIVSDLWWSMGAILSAGLSLTWLRDNVLLDINYQEMADLATEAPPGSEGLYFMPHLAGERTPYMDDRARGGFIGLTLRHDRRHLCRAVMEGVVFALRQALDVMLEMGIPVEEITASGGGTNHPLWLQLQADIFDRPIHRTRTREAAAVGAALLGGIGVGVFEDAQAAVRRTVRRYEAVVTPDPANVRRYAESYATYCQLYPALKSVIGYQ